jgi:arylsulfatase A-like enzyme
VDSSGRTAGARGGARALRAAAALAALAAAGCSGAPAGPPHVVLITLDALRQDHLSAFGYARPTSPNIDRLAARGLVFRTIVPPSCSTKPSLTSLLTGADARLHQVQRHEGPLPDDVGTLAQVFQRAGYATAGFMSSPWLDAELGFDRGFEHYDDFEVDHEPPAAEVGAHVVEWLEGARSDPRPKFVYAHFFEPHPPWSSSAPWWQAGAEPLKPFGRGCGYIPTEAQLRALPEAEREAIVAAYDAAIFAADAEIGRILASLEASGDLARSIVAIGTDHGLELLDRYSTTHGHNPYDEVVRTFLVLYDGRGGLPSLDTTRIQGRTQDIGATLLARAGLARPAEFDAVDLIGEADRLPALAISRCYGVYALRTLDHKLAGFGIRESKSHGRVPTNGTYLYDLRRDPGERTDVKDAEPEVHARMLRERWQLGGKLAAAAMAEDPIPAELDPAAADRLRALGYAE